VPFSELADFVRGSFLSEPLTLLPFPSLTSSSSPPEIPTRISLNFPRRTEDTENGVGDVEDVLAEDVLAGGDELAEDVLAGGDELAEDVLAGGDELSDDVLTVGEVTVFESVDSFERKIIRKFPRLCSTTLTVVPRGGRSENPSFTFIATSTTEILVPAATIPKVVIA